VVIGTWLHYRIGLNFQRFRMTERRAQSDKPALRRPAAKALRRRAPSCRFAMPPAMRDDRNAMSRARTPLMILLFAALPAGLLATGCNPDTRELLLDPRLPMAGPYTGGTWTTTPAPA
jgi:hypothetical protein